MATYNANDVLTFGGLTTSGQIGLREVDTTRFLSPVISFKVNLFPPTGDIAIGPATNSNTTDMPNLYGTPNANATLDQRTIQVPGVNGYLRHGDTFDIAGQLGKRIKSTYSSGTVDDAFSTPLMVTKIQKSE